jgi:hypothetical protein
MNYIYCLETDGFIWYVGVTEYPNKRRLYHLGRYNTTSGAGLIPQEYEINFKILESNVPHHLRGQRERFWYDLLKPILNHTLPGATKEDKLAKARLRKAENRDRINAQARYRRAHEAAITQ